MLACLQTLPQLTSHTQAALNVGVAPVEIREAIYQLAPFLGFPRTLNAVATINDVFRARGVELPLPAQGTVPEAERYPKGLAEQAPLYGDEIKDNLADLPEPFNEALPRFLTEFCFGDFYTRGGLTLAQRELLVLCALAAIGDTSAQLGPHGASLPPGRKHQDGGSGRAGPLLPLHRIPTRRRRNPRRQRPVNSAATVRPPGPSRVGHPRLLGDLRSPRDQELADLGTVVHISTLRRVPARLGCPISTRLDGDFPSDQRPGLLASPSHADHFPPARSITQLTRGDSTDAWCCHVRPG